MHREQSPEAISGFARFFKGSPMTRHVGLIRAARNHRAAKLSNGASLKLPPA